MLFCFVENVYNLASLGILQAIDNNTANAMTLFMQRRLLNKLNLQLSNLGKTFSTNVKNDYYLPDKIASNIGAFVESLWFEVHLQVLDMMKGVVKLDELDKHEACSVAAKHFCCCENFVGKFTAFCRYHLEPFDKTFWGKVRDPFFLTFFLLNLIPYVGLQTMIFFFKLIIIEKRDDFQVSRVSEPTTQTITNFN